MTTDTPDIGDTTNTLRKTPSHEPGHEFSGETQGEPQSNSEVGRGCDHLQSDSSQVHGEEDEASTCNFCIKEGRFTTFDALFIFGGMITYIADLVTDLLVAVNYFREGYKGWSIMTMIFVLIPSLVLQYFSFRWFVSDQDQGQHPDHCEKGFLRKMWNWCQWLTTHILQLGAIKRYWRTLKYGLRSRRDKSSYKRMIWEYRDITMLRLLEAFMESAPQLVLQVYIMVEEEQLYWLTAVSALVSLSSLSWALEAYHKALRDSRVDRENINYFGVALRMAWRLFTITARVIAMALFASIYEWWVFVVCGAHWAVMTVWIVWQQTDFCTTKLEEILFDAVMGIIHIFCFFNMKEGITRYRALFFYTIIFIENTVMFALWYCEQESRERMYGLPSLIFVWGGFFFGIFLMVFYYRLCHPTGKIPFCVKWKTEEKDKPPLSKDGEIDAELCTDAYITGATDESDSGPSVNTAVTTGNRERQPYYVNLFSYRWRRVIHPKLLTSPRRTFVNSIELAPPTSSPNSVRTMHPEMFDTRAVYLADGQVSTKLQVDGTL